VDGALALWVEPKGKRIATAVELSPESIELALSIGLPVLAAKQRRRELLVELIDGQPAGASPLARSLLANGARVDYRGLVIRGMQRITPEPAEQSDVPDDEDDA
ncbi:MAG TPA: hypothetical protein VH143_18085, partial [Kofleriaceae bacterium]|nr:hypothetical protein [Kofleriaceae bacterium]